MSNLLSQASLVMIPSGYKEDIVYSPVPTNGNGDLTFTRASNGTRINSAGLVEVTPWNLLSYSNTFSDSSWVKSSCTLTSGQNDPNGGTNGWRYLSSVAATGYAYQNGVLQNGVQYTFYIYAKSNTGSNQTMYFTANSGSFTSPAFTLTSSWQLCSWTFTANSTGNNILFGYNPSATLDLLVYGAQLNIGSTAKPYFPTTDRLNVPRLTYQNGGGGCPSLLLEKQSTNLVSYSEDFTQWTARSVSVTSNNTTSPDGTQNADLITATSGTIHDVYNTFNGGTTNTVSIFVKKGTSQYIYISTSYQATTGDSSTILVDLDNKTLINSSSGNVAFVSGSIVEMGNGWLRVIYTTTAASATGMYIFAGISSTYTFNLSLYGRQVSTTTQTAYFYGAQAEASSYATSYIPTTSSSATRVVDQSVTTLGSSIIGQSEGVFFVDVDFTPYGTGVYNNKQMIIIRNNSFYDYYIYISSHGTNGQLIASVVQTGVVTITFTSTQTLPNRFKCALAYKSGDTVFYVNGNLVGTNTTTFSPLTLNDLRLNHEEGSFKINEIALFKTRLTNAELASLTTI